MLLNLKIFKICIMHEFAPQKVKICKHARKKYHAVKSWNEYLQSLRSATSLYKNMHLHGNPGSNYKYSGL